MRDSIKMKLKEIETKDMDGINLSRDKDRRWALVIAEINLWVP